jgi:hypothetical protein
MVRGHLAYYAGTGNTRALKALGDQATWHWCKALRRRSQRHRLDWEKTNLVTTQWLSPVGIVHPYSWVLRGAPRRLYPRQESCAVVLHAGVCVGIGCNWTCRIKANPYRNPPQNPQRQGLPPADLLPPLRPQWMMMPVIIFCSSDGQARLLRLLGGRSTVRADLCVDSPTVNQYILSGMRTDYSDKCVQMLVGRRMLCAPGSVADGSSILKRVIWVSSPR